MITVKHYTNEFKGKAVHVLRSEYVESVTDKSFFRPELGEVRSKLSSLSGANVHGAFDFPDGKDTGDTISTTLRNKGLDRTEVDSMYRTLKQNLEDKKELDREMLNQMKKDDNLRSVDDAIKRIADSVGSENSTSE